MDESVLFLFLKNNKLLVEHRLTDSGKFEEMLLPGGGIEDVDKVEGEDYRVNAMKREIREELGEQISIKDFTFLTTAESGEQRIMFHSYVINDWDGELPEYSIEDGAPNAKLEWLTLEDAFLAFTNDVARTVVGKAIASLRAGTMES